MLPNPETLDTIGGRWLDQEPARSAQKLTGMEIELRPDGRVAVRNHLGGSLRHDRVRVYVIRNGYGRLQDESFPLRSASQYPATATAGLQAAFWARLRSGCRYGRPC